MEAELPETLA